MLFEQIRNIVESVDKKHALTISEIAEELKKKKYEIRLQKIAETLKKMRIGGEVCFEIRTYKLNVQINYLERDKQAEREHTMEAFHYWGT